MKEKKEKPLMSKPEVSSAFAQNELDKAEKQFEKFNENVQELTLDRMNTAPKLEQEQQTKISNREAQASKDVYLKPVRSIMAVDPKTGLGQKFNEKFREAYEFDKQYVQFIAENKEIGGEDIDLWTKPYGGMPAEEWKVPVNKPVWGPRYLAEQIKRKCYHRLVMQNTVMGADGMGTYQGSMVADTTIQRLDAHPVSQRKSVFMGASGF